MEWTLTDQEKKLFPLKTIASVVALFRSILRRSTDPDLTFLSIICGCIENTLTCNSTHHQLAATARSAAIAEEAEALAAGEGARNVQIVTVQACSSGDEGDFPEVELDVVMALRAKFAAILCSAVDSRPGDAPVTREIVKKVSDVIWNTLTRSYYKDRAHLQSVYSYLTGNKLDCFGVAVAVVAGCQILGLGGVHLALSEDHVWVIFGPDNETVEVTWHGKGNEDKRGQAVDPKVSRHSWLYVGGKPVVCSRCTEVAALVSSINPSISATTDSLEVASLQQSLLWLLNDGDHLAKYPMALGNLADLEELNRTPGRVHCSRILDEAIDVARRHYDNRHVYPYTYQAGYFYRNRMYKEALESWANAADVIRTYNYSRDDEEIYKEFLEIANELIPYVMKVEGSGHSARSILKDSECFASLLRFYDGICQWEQGSSTPVLHIGWAKPLVNTISKFDAQVRSHVVITCSLDDAVDAQASAAAPVADPGQRKDGLLDANANQVLLAEWTPAAAAAGGAAGGGARLGTSALAALTDLCGRTLLSPAFFLGGAAAATARTGPATPTESLLVAGGASRVLQSARPPAPTPAPKARPRLFLRSHKMAGLKDLLLAEKLNTHAISLQLTAQSQLQLGGRKLRDQSAKESGNKAADSLTCSSSSSLAYKECANAAPAAANAAAAAPDPSARSKRSRKD